MYIQLCVVNANMSSHKGDTNIIRMRMKLKDIQLTQLLLKQSNNQNSIKNVKNAAVSY